MTCRCEIIVATYPDAVYIPVQAVVRVKGKTTVYLPGKKEPVPRRSRSASTTTRWSTSCADSTPGAGAAGPPLGPSDAPVAEEVPSAASTPAPAATVPNGTTPNGTTPAVGANPDAPVALRLSTRRRCGT